MELEVAAQLLEHRGAVEDEDVVRDAPFADGVVAGVGPAEAFNEVVDESMQYLHDAYGNVIRSMQDVTEAFNDVNREVASLKQVEEALVGIVYAINDIALQNNASTQEVLASTEQMNA